jgi:creatinine amidohydrolase
MGWVDVAAYLETNDMVIIPLGSTEQHGPQLPLGSDFYEAFEMAKEVSKQTGTVVAPLLLAGYSEYHLGFPGSISLRPETMEQVIFEGVESLIKHGFRRIMFFNYHGGNSVIQQKLIHRINHTTEATAVAIGLGASFQATDDGEFFDWHAGVSETSNMLFIAPELVRMDRAEKPDIRFTAQAEELRVLAEDYPELMSVWETLMGVPSDTKKGGASDELSSNGIWSFSDPRSATAEIGERNFVRMTQNAVRFVEAWKLSSM